MSGEGHLLVHSGCLPAETPGPEHLLKSHFLTASQGRDRVSAHEVGGTSVQSTAL